MTLVVLPLVAKARRSHQQTDGQRKCLIKLFRLKKMLMSVKNDGNIPFAGHACATVTITCNFISPTQPRHSAFPHPFSLPYSVFRENYHYYQQIIMPSVADRTVYPSSTSEWVKPAARPVEIDDLIAGVDRYNPANVSFLEDYLYDQVKSGSYDCLANLATLKLYQFNPNLLNTDVLVHILLKTLTATPGPDFGLAVALIGDRAFSVPASEEEDEMEGHLPALLEFLTKAHSLLRTCQFSQFWKLLNGDEEAATILRQNQLAEHPLFVKLIRTEVVSKAVASTNQRISSSLLGKWLDLSGDELNKFITSELEWTIEGDVVTIGLNEDNDVKGKTVRENVELNQLTKVIAAGQR